MRLATSAASATFLLAAAAHAQIGPDCINASFNDIARHGTNAAGTITGYSSGNVTCNHGDVPMSVQPDATTRPLVAMNMYRYKSFGNYSRLEQLGQGWAKWVGVPAGGNNSFCGTCVNSGTFGMMGVNCADVYSSGFNSPASMGPRSQINPATGRLLGGRGTNTGEAAISTRVQVPTVDVTNQPAGTRFFFETIILLPDDAQYVRPGERLAVNGLNNATSQEININGGTGVPTLLGTPAITSALEQWRAIDRGVVIVNADHDDTPNPAVPGAFIRSRYQVAARATQIGANQWHYEYAVFNLNSDRGVGTITIPLAALASFTDFSFHHPASHSGEPFSNAPWTAKRNGHVLTLTTDAYAADPNANAIRWGTTYNFGFTTNVAPNTNGRARLSLFKPAPSGGVTTIDASGLPVPYAPACVSDFDLADGVTVDDLVAYLTTFSGGTTAADIDNGSDAAPGSFDDAVSIDDLIYYLRRFEIGC